MHGSNPWERQNFSVLALSTALARCLKIHVSR